MNWNKLIRQLHRWLSIAFTLAVIANLVTLVMGKQVVWVGLMALPPLIILLLTGLYLFVLPYTAEGAQHTRRGMKKAPSESPSELIDARIQELGDWRGKTLSRVRALIKQADPGVVEEWKWRGVPVWSHDGILCTGETYKTSVKLTFARGAALKDPSGLFNSSLEGNTRRAIDLHEGEKLNEAALKALIREAVVLNVSSGRSKSARRPKASA